jgi:hypothetical protein
MANWATALAQRREPPDHRLRTLAANLLGDDHRQTKQLNL